MARISIYNPSGELPRVDPKLLGDSYATRALNVELRRGQIAPSKAPLAIGISVFSGTETIFQYNKEANSGNGYWFAFASDVDVVRGQIAGDTTLRTYYTGDGVPKVTDVTLAQAGAGPYPGASHDLGLPSPGTPIAAGPSGSVPDGGQEVNTVYVRTVVSARGEEGPPSDPSIVVTRWDTGTVELSGLTPPSGNFNLITQRIYRAEATGEYLFVDEIPISQVTYSDSIDSEGLGEIIPSSDWYAPDSAMIGLTGLPNGGMMGWFGNTLAFCEPYFPHAWPTGYQLALESDVVAAAVTQAGIVVATKGNPYLISGSDPSSYAQYKMDVIQACVSKRSMVDMGSYAIYASADGLVVAGGADARLITEPMILPEQWRTRIKPESIHAYRYEDRYLAFYDTGTEQGAFTFHPQDGFYFYDEYADCAYLDEESGELYVKQGTSINKWDEGAAKTYTWTSKVWAKPPQGHFSAAKVDADSYPVTLLVYGDGNLIKTKSVTDNKAFRIPAKSRYREMQFTLTGAAPVSAVQFASSFSEIQ